MLQRGASILKHCLPSSAPWGQRLRIFRSFAGDNRNQANQTIGKDTLDTAKPANRDGEKIGIDLEAEALREEFVKQRRDATEPFKVQTRNDRNKPLLTDRPTSLNLKQFEVLSPTDVNPKDHLDRPTGVMDFIDQRMALKNGNIVVKGVFPDAFNISNIIVFGGVLLFNNQLFSWDVTNGADIRAHHFDIVEVIKPSPAYIIVGTGESKLQLSPEIMDRLYSFKARVDVVDTFKAVSTFNICSGDGMNVIAFLIPGTETSSPFDDESDQSIRRALKL